MLDFAAVRNKTISLAEMTHSLTKADLQTATNEMIDTMLAIITDATDEDVVFVPEDPIANDTFGKPEEATLSWTLGHVVVHATASSEEAAALALSLARGLVVEGRSRYEVPWQSQHSIAQLRHRLEESRRMRLAMLEAWPDEPHLEITYTPIPSYGPVNAVSRFIFGLFHDDSHVEQLRQIMRQAKAARNLSVAHSA